MQNYSGEEGLQYHVQIRPGDVGKYVILPGDPKRCAKIAAHFDDAKLIADGYNCRIQHWQSLGAPGAPLYKQKSFVAKPSSFFRRRGAGGQTARLSFYYVTGLC